MVPFSCLECNPISIGIKTEQARSIHRHYTLRRYESVGALEKRGDG